MESLRVDICMETAEKSPAIDCDLLADFEAIPQTKGIVRDPELYRRVTERADRVRREALETFGVQEIGAEIIRTLAPRAYLGVF